MKIIKSLNIEFLVLKFVFIVEEVNAFATSLTEVLR